MRQEGAKWASMGMSCWRGKLKAAARDFYVERAASKLGELQSLDSEWSKDLLLSRDNGTITLIDLSRAAAGAWMRSLQTLNAEQTQDFARAGYKSTSLSDIVTMVKGPPGHWKGRADRDARSSEGRPLNVLLSRQKQAVVIFGDKDWIKITITGNEAKKLKNPGYENCHFIKMFDWMQRNGRLVEEPTESRPGLVPICRQNPATQVQTLIFVIDIHHGQRVEELVAFEEGRMQTQKFPPMTTAITLRISVIAINLQDNGSNLVFLDFPSNAQAALQAGGRVIRIGQTLICNIDIIAVDQNMTSPFRPKPPPKGSPSSAASPTLKPPKATYPRSQPPSTRPPVRTR
ncbi:MAG: hypothetical protein ALECFALPRED_002607 [Alectoria fallacina]|uniref:Uncharacterized protein n=1 Tax=Alectoria fallacina TaxID=1903189 RepID=A0A8H3EH87_9LECA|nr:MAG: hypothetical protein ALECFALPRED_002607 [Alectoria fallacina]